MSKTAERAYRNIHPKVRQRIEDTNNYLVVLDGVKYDRDGNDISHLVDITPKLAKATDRQARGLQATNELNIHAIENGEFVLAFFKQSQTMMNRFPTLSKQDIARLMFMGTYVAWETNRLQYSNGVIISEEGLAELLEMSTKRFRELLKRFINEDILRVSEDSEIFISELVFYRGKADVKKAANKELTFAALYRDTVRDLYQQFKGRRLGQLANIYEILPFLNFDTNMACHNPEETDTDLLKPMNLSEIAEILGYEDARKLRRALNPIKVGEHPVFWTPESVHDKRERMIIINPRVIFKGNAETLRGIKAMFN